MSESEFESYRNLAIEAAVWLASIVGCAVALILSRRAPLKLSILSLLLALIALTVGYVGLWTPFSVVPRIAYTSSNDHYHWALDLNQFFVVPVVLGLISLVFAVSRSCPSSRPATTSEPTCKNREDSFGAVSIAMLLLMTAWASAWAMVIASALGLAAGLIWFRRGRFRGAMIVMAAAGLMAAALALALRLGRGQ
jgi:hypothetical protein